MNFADRMKEIIKKGLAHKNIFPEQAPEKNEELGQQCILNYEISELEKDVENKLLIIGNEVYSVLMKKEQCTISKNTIEIKDILLEIMNLEKLILEKEHLLKQAE